MPLRIPAGLAVLGVLVLTATLWAAGSTASAPAPASAPTTQPAPTLQQLQAENRTLRESLAKLQAGTPRVWMAVGFFGQFVFMLRFVVQWIASERKKQSVVPVAFWYLSVAGSLITVVYAIYRQDVVFSAAFCLNLLIYARNLYFIHGKPKGRQDAAKA